MPRYFSCIVSSLQITAWVLTGRYCRQQVVSVRRCRLFIAAALAVGGGGEAKESGVH